MGTNDDKNLMTPGPLRAVWISAAMRLENENLEINFLLFGKYTFSCLFVEIWIERHFPHGKPNFQLVVSHDLVQLQINIGQ